jgi:RHS repeat-associated protein
VDDALGSVRGLTDSSGALTGSTDYDAFGAIRGQTGSSLPLGFTGELTDPTTGFLDLRARDLDPVLGRFLSTDNVFPNAPGTQGFNLYAYTANNPTTWADLSGHSVGSAINGLASLVAGCLAYLPCSGLLQEQLALAATAAVSGNWILGLGAAVGTVFVLVWCALTEPCAQAAQDIQLIAKTYGGGVDTGGGNRPPSPASCIWDAVKAWAAGNGNPADGVHACAEAIRTATGATVAPVRGGSGEEGESQDLGSTVLVSQILQHPDVLEGKNPDGLLTMLGGVPPGWKIETLGRGTHEGQGFLLRQYTDGGTPTGRMIRWHPGDGHHGPGAYWRVTSSEFGKSEIIPAGQWTP